PVVDPPAGGRAVARAGGWTRHAAQPAGSRRARLAEAERGRGRACAPAPVADVSRRAGGGRPAAERRPRAAAGCALDRDEGSRRLAARVLGRALRAAHAWHRAVARAREPARPLARGGLAGGVPRHTLPLDRAPERPAPGRGA